MNLRLLGDIRMGHTFILGLIGAIGGWPVIKGEFFTSPKLKCRVLAQYMPITNSDSTAAHLKTISFLMLNRAVAIKSIRIRVKNENDPEEIEAKIHIWREYHNLSTKKKLVLNPSKDYVTSVAYLKADEPVVGYLSFVVPVKGTTYQYFRVIVEDYDGHEISSGPLFEKDLDANQMIYDDSIWQNDSISQSFVESSRNSKNNK